MDPILLTGYISIIVQILTGIVSFTGLLYPLKEKDLILRETLALETGVQFVEAIFYIYIIYRLVNHSFSTHIRYYDWFITTPTMLISTILFLQYLEKKEKNEVITFKQVIKNEWKELLLIVIANLGMLLFGFWGEMGMISKDKGFIVGFAFFIIAFYLIYKSYAKEKIGKIVLGLTFALWSIYGWVYLAPVKERNIAYNFLDIFSKNFYGVFLFYYIRKIHQGYSPEGFVSL
jgi:hypothetical protein